jgi:hypothetical protein
MVEKVLPCLLLTVLLPPQVLHAHAYRLDELWQDTPLTKTKAIQYEMKGGSAAGKRQS